MIKSLLILSLWIGISYAANSQTKDTLCFPIAKAQEFAIYKRQKLAQDTLIQSLRSDIFLLEQSIASYQAKEGATNEMTATYQSMTKAMQEQRSLLEGQITLLEKELKRQKVKTKLTGIGGLLLTGVTAFLLLSK